jgi:beta-galactosidase/beta-glucuronidase
MKSKLKIEAMRAAFLFAGVLSAAVRVHGWSPAPIPLPFTRWAQDVHPDQTPEYPRPQLTRPAGTWRSLNGLWQIDYNASDISAGAVPVPFGRTLPHEILVPYPLESSLGGLRVQAPAHSMFYRRLLPARALLPGCAAPAGRRVLRFEKSDWNTTVYFNGRRLGDGTPHLGGYDPFSYELPALATAGGENELIVAVYDATDKNPAHNQARGKQQRDAFSKPFGMMYTGSSGLWDTVWLECVPGGSYVDDLHALPDVAGRRVLLQVDVAGGADAAAGRCAVNATLLGAGGAEVASAASAAWQPGHRLELRFGGGSAMRLWSPSDPFLYNVSVTVACAAAANAAASYIDVVQSYVGMRDISVLPQPPPHAAAGMAVPSVALNGRPFFQVGVLDQVRLLARD